jgi:hypothetical protein
VKTHRLTIDVPYVARVVPKGARNPRHVLYREQVALDLRIVSAADLPVAARAKDLPGAGPREVTWHGNDGDLWLPLRVGADAGDLPAEQAFAALGSGASTLGFHRNPFLQTGQEPVYADRFSKAEPYDPKKVRQFLHDERERTLANVSRLAADFLLCGDGRILRRSTGPWWQVTSTTGIVLKNGGFDLPASRVFQVFGGLRLEDARRFREIRYPEGAAQTSGSLEILDPASFPDLDARETALLIADPVYAGWFRDSGRELGGEADVAARLLVRRMAELRGCDEEAFLQDRTGMPWPQGVEPPPVEELAAVVAGMRAYFDLFMGAYRKGNPLVEHRTCRQRFDQAMGGCLARWDLFEAPRMPDPEAVPDLPAPEGPRP